MGSRAIYNDGWMASARGPRLPWMPGLPLGIATWTPEEDIGAPGLDEDWSQAHDLAAEHTKKLETWLDLFLVESAKNDTLPIDGRLRVMTMHPEDRPCLRTTNGTVRLALCIPDSSTAALGNRSNLVIVELELPRAASGMLSKPGGGSRRTYAPAGRGQSFARSTTCS